MSYYDLNPLNAVTLNVPQPTTDRFEKPGLAALPLNLLATILSFIKDVDDLARMCRTCRLLHYMTIPQLYKHITLTAYHEIRYHDDIPEGFGSASPFSMGLNALVTRSVASLVKSLSLQGNWREDDLEKYAKAGRVPDGSMMLNIAVRASVDRCVELQSFKWDLNTRLLPTVYTGLAALKNLQAFHLRFPSARTPQPTTEIPALPELREFTMTNYDPLNCPDDLSNMFYHATKLHTLNMHFSPRMRDAAESSVRFITFFKKNVALNRPMNIRNVGMYNVLATRDNEVLTVLDTKTIEVLTVINSLGGEVIGEPSGQQNLTHWVDKTWDESLQEIRKVHNNLRSIRDDRITRQKAKELLAAPNLERIYLINAKYNGASNYRSSESTPFNAGSSPSSGSSGPTPIGTLPRASTSTGELIRDNILNAMCSVQGSKLKHLILPGRIPLASHSMATLIRSCPNLSQLSCAVEEIVPESLRIILPFGKELFAFRLTCPEQSGEEGIERRKRFQAFVERNDHDYFLSLEMAGRFGGSPKDFDSAKYIGFGDKVWEAGGLYEEIETIMDDDGNEMQKTVSRRRIKTLQLKDVMNIEIWRMDTLDII